MPPYTAPARCRSGKHQAFRANWTPFWPTPNPNGVLASAATEGGVPWGWIDRGLRGPPGYGGDRWRHGRSAGFSELLHPDASEVTTRVDADAAKDIMYTSGTTGAPKAVVVPYGKSDGGLRPNQWSGLGFMTASPFSTTSGTPSSTDRPEAV